jgi:hypothetical protein
MGVKSPREKAEACFAVARSTTHAGERENAIGRGLAICEREGLDPDTFDIPGRAKPEPKPKPFVNPFAYEPMRGTSARPSYGFTAEELRAAHYSSEEVDAAYARFRKGMEDATREAMRDQWAKAMKAERERAAAFAARERKKREESAIADLWAVGMRAYPTDGAVGRWTVQRDNALFEVTREELVELARASRSITAEAKRIEDIITVALGRQYAC